MTSLPDSISTEQWLGIPLEALPPHHVFPLNQLLDINGPEVPPHFEAFWERRYHAAINHAPAPQLLPSDQHRPGVHVYDFRFQSTGGISIQGWLTVPVDQPVACGLVVGHGYGGRDGPDPVPVLPDAAIFYPCFRGLARSAMPPISPDPHWHVLHDIDHPDRYVHGGCAEDLWLTISALLELYPQVAGRVGYVGISFSGGIGALALACERRLRKAHLDVPSFGHHPLRLRLPTLGSGAALQRVWREGRLRMVSTLALHDAAAAARFIRIPVQCACAISDPFVTPPGQFAIFNALGGPRELIVLDRGHAAEGPLGAQSALVDRERRRFLSGLSA